MSTLNYRDVVTDLAHALQRNRDACRDDADYDKPRLATLVEFVGKDSESLLVKLEDGTLVQFTVRVY